MDEKERNDSEEPIPPEKTEDFEMSDDPQSIGDPPPEDDEVARLVVEQPRPKPDPAKGMGTNMPAGA
jgi:hypothetical protein